MRTTKTLIRLRGCGTHISELFLTLWPTFKALTYFLEHDMSFFLSFFFFFFFFLTFLWPLEQCTTYNRSSMVRISLGPCVTTQELRLVSSAILEHTNNNTSHSWLGLVIVSNDRRTTNYTVAILPKSYLRCAISNLNVKKIAFGNNEHNTDKKIEVSVLLRLFISSNAHCLRNLAYTWAELHFQRFHNGPNDPKGNEI